MQRKAATASPSMGGAASPKSGYSAEQLFAAFVVAELGRRAPSTRGAQPKGSHDPSSRWSSAERSLAALITADLPAKMPDRSEGLPVSQSESERSFADVLSADLQSKPQV
ncbi:hypothetical protein [Methylobacterium sp. 4-46]|uniref:hypothetical protein n=1 Tax=Methylobacterium sp. (strain 4-46) TaxID=426117 RepID=UPI0005BE82CC|nr:hypothetical protein [Methylobacterium sp. 4-46]